MPTCVEAPMQRHLPFQTSGQHDHRAYFRLLLNAWVPKRWHMTAMRAVPSTGSPCFLILPIRHAQLSMVFQQRGKCARPLKRGWKWLAFASSARMTCSNSTKAARKPKNRSEQAVYSMWLVNIGVTWMIRYCLTLLHVLPKHKIKKWKSFKLIGFDSTKVPSVNFVQTMESGKSPVAKNTCHWRAAIVQDILQRNFNCKVQTECPNMHHQKKSSPSLFRLQQKKRSKHTFQKHKAPWGI